jgi:hypothetical protein
MIDIRSVSVAPLLTENKQILKTLLHTGRIFNIRLRLIMSEIKDEDMPSKKAVGIAPLVTGIILTSQSLGQLLESGFSLWTGISLVGGLAAILVGAGILSRWRGFDTESKETTDLSGTLLSVIAVASFVVGAVVAVV